MTISVILHLGGSVGFNPTVYSALEGSGSVTVTVDLSVATEIDIVVELVTSAGTAASGKQQFNTKHSIYLISVGGM